VIGRLLIALLLACSVPAVAGAEAVRLGPTDVERNIGAQVEFYRDPTRAQTIDTIQSMPFVGHGDQNLSFGFTDDAVWLRFTVRADYSAQREWFVEIDHPLHDRVELYSPIAGGGWQRDLSGDMVGDAVKAVKLRTIAFPLTIPPQSTTTFYLRIVSGNSIVVPVVLVEKLRYLTRSAAVEFSFGLFYGGLLIMVLFNLVLYVALRDSSYLLYSAGVLSTTLFQATLSGHAMHYLWPHNAELSNPVSLYALIATISIGLWFSTRFLETRRHMPFWHWTMVGLAVTAFALLPLDAVKGYTTAISVGAALSVVSGVVGLLAGIFSLRTGVHSARFYVLARSGFCIGAVLTAGRQLGMFPDMFLTEHAMRIGSFLETVLLAFALSDRYNRLRAEKEAAQKKVAEELRRLDTFKDEILANTSHELRTPLHGIIGLSESMLDGAAGPLSAAAQSNLSMMASSGQRLARLVDDILDFSRLKTHELRLDPKPVDLHVAVDVVVTLIRPLLGDRPIQLINDVDDSVPAVFADEARLQQILNNLIGNAVKFTDQGEVRIAAALDDGFVRIDVTDTGIGIPTAALDRIFESFEQVEGAATRERGGTGLGLSVTRQLVELQGGRITVQSQIGRGSTFSFTLPVSRVRPIRTATVTPTIAETGVPSGNGDARQVVEVHELLAVADGDRRVRILVVDDEPVNQQVLSNHLTVARYSVVQAMNGHQALQILESEPQFDLVLLDVMMPRMSGYEVCEKIRRTHLATELPVIMVTAKNRTDDLVTGLSVGANDYIGKPFSKQELLARIKTHLNLLKINNAYGYFVPHEFLRQLGKDSIIDVDLGDNVELEVAVMMSDIRGFTTLSQAMTPAENFNFINGYFGRMGPVIREHDGFINSFIGDAIMSLFVGGAAHAVAAAVASSRRLDRYNEERVASGRQPIDAGFAVHLGKARLGIVGEVQRRQGEVFSDAINLASRIEALTKRYGSRLIISADVHDRIAADHSHSVRWLDRVQVRGRHEQIDIYEVLDCVTDRALREASRDEFEAAVSESLRGDISAAIRRFDAVVCQNPADRAARWHRDDAEQRAGNRAAR
jgi:signal transduction histidine kinase/class 3 adenylate cyclase/ActR/RegA family two-component response regulator